GSAAAADRDRYVPIRVLVEDDVSRTRVGEGSGGDGVVALRAELELEPLPRHDPRLIEVRPVEVQLHVPEPVDREHRAPNARPAELGLRDVESREGLRVDRRAE